mmetsp:Transcript_131863/g.228489  ORF Transcript_131863/g.228489 Transcript_131863/m.228489 type:complete len:80 (+) Transcript_131863:600-839(+)
MRLHSAEQPFPCPHDLTQPTHKEQVRTGPVGRGAFWGQSGMEDTNCSSDNNGPPSPSQLLKDGLTGMSLRDPPPGGGRG